MNTTTIADKTILKKCNHSFCKDCISKWLLRNTSCPNCRTHVSYTDTLKAYKQQGFIQVTFITYDINQLDIILKIILKAYIDTTKTYSSTQWVNQIMNTVLNDQDLIEIFKSLKSINGRYFISKEEYLSLKNDDPSDKVFYRFVNYQ